MKYLFEEKKINTFLYYIIIHCYVVHTNLTKRKDCSKHGKGSVAT